MAYLLGIDLGTSSLKSALVTEDGKVLAENAEAYSISSPHGGWSEQDPEMWWKACRDTVKAVIAQSSVSPDEIAALSFSGQMHGLVMLDENYRVIRPAILHNDARSGEEVRKIKDSLGMERVRDWMMNPVYSGFLLVSLLWVKEHEPENFGRVRHVCLPKDYLKLRLSGELTSDYSDASATLAFDQKKSEWSSDIINFFGLPEEIFPPLYGTAEAIGHVCAEAAHETGLSEKTAVVSGGGDQVMQGIGNGVVAIGGASANIGTAGQVSFQSDHPILNPALSTNTFCGYKKGRWFTMGAIMNAGLCLKWINQILDQHDYVKLNREVELVPPGSRGVIFLPYLNGERTPHLNPDISGELVGVNLSTGRPELTRAVMEGVTFALNQCIEVCGELGLKASGHIVASGGGARSGPWRQIMADVFNIPVRVSEGDEQACIGAAIAAGTGARIYRDIEEGCRAAVRYQDLIVEPDEARHRIYEEYYQIYKDIYAAGWRELERVTKLGRRDTTG